MSDFRQCQPQTMKFSFDQQKTAANQSVEVICVPFGCHSCILLSVLRQTHSHFHSDFSTECDPNAFPSVSCILSYPYGHPVVSLCHVFQHYLKNCTIFGEKKSLKDNCLKEYSSIKFHENLPSGNLVIHADRRIGRQIRRSFIVTFRKFCRHLTRLCLKTSNGHIRLRCKPLGRSAEPNRRYEIYIHGSVHRDSVLIRSNKMQLYAGIYLLQAYSTCFGRPSRPSSRVKKNCNCSLWYRS